MRASDDNSFTALFDVEPFLRNQVTKTQIDHLRNRIDGEGLRTVATDVGVDQTTLLRVCAGFGHRLTPTTAGMFRDYFDKKDHR